MGGLHHLHYDGSDTSDSDGMVETRHSVNGSSTTAVSTTNGNNRNVEDDDADVELLLRLWKRTFPSRLRPEALSRSDLATFLGRALTLVNSGEGHMEDTIMGLTFDGGLSRLKELTDCSFDNITDNALFEIWRNLLLVYFQIVGHDIVLESEAVDCRVFKLMEHLYGEDGKRGSSVFRAALRSLLFETRQTNITAQTTQEHTELCIAVLSRMLSTNNSRITAEICAVTESLVSLLRHPHLSNKTHSRVLLMRAIINRSCTVQDDASALTANNEDALLLEHVAASASPAKASSSTMHVASETPRGPSQTTFTLRKPATKKQATSSVRKLKAAPGASSADSRPQSTPAASASAPSSLPHDLPEGVLRPTFNRHDNDKEHIADIKIMPTLEEVLSDIPSYLPREDPSTWHKSSMPGVIDRHFRLVREDTVGQLRIAIKTELAALQRTEPDHKPTTTSISTTTSASAHKVAEIKGARTNVYHNAVLDRVFFDAQKGLQFILAISQPNFASRSRSSQHREASWKREQSLQPDSLICLISSNGGAHFLVVHCPPPPKPGKPPNPNALHKRYSLGAQRERAFVIAELATTHPDDASAILRTLVDADKTAKARCSLVEFPGQILQSFAPTLAALQVMSTNIRDIPFPNALTPDFKNFTPSPPAYSRARGFQYRLQALLPEGDRRYHASERMDSVLKRSVLDDVQQDAVRHALTNELALIQGPPGTGKSFTGVKLIEALLENRSAGNLGPILCVCFTNHALDQLLEHLMDAGVSGVIRMGSRSKSERLAPVNIREVAMNYSFEKREGAQMGRAKKNIKMAVRNIDALVGRWHGVLVLKHVEDTEIATLLARDHRALHSQIMAERRGVSVRSPIQVWLEGGVGTIPSLPDDNRNGDRHTGTYNMSHADRQQFHRKLLASIFDDIYQELGFELQSFYDSKGIIDAMRGNLDLRALSNADVIGVTTSGLAGKYRRLRQLKSKVVVVEEAGEVLEAHLLTAMLPSVEHAILIGDHQQLRPKVNNYDLSIDNPCSRITLDVSLFERLVSPRYDLSPGLPFVTLEMQRRMHPSISDLIRSTLYPNLGDAPNVQSYPPVAGMAKRLFWLDHRNKEDDTRNNPQSVSQSNNWEVGMVAALVGHLQKQGAYSAGDIAVLTPYSGQLKEMQAKLGATYGIMLSERDIDDGIQASGNNGRSRNAIRLSTVDAFQGEEAKVIIISMVRSNDKKICGFLATTNRINVLLSRAMHGMYVIGNSNTTSEIPMWQNIVNLFKADGNFGPALEIACGRHPNSEAPLLVREPRDFLRASTEVGCNAECGEWLPCGHRCIEKCHSEAVHNRVKCKQPCDRPMQDCEHLCPKPCNEECEPTCRVTIQCDLSLPCGHQLDEMHCFQQHHKLSDIRCSVEVEQTVPGCGHKTMSPCYFPVEDPRFRCEEACAAALACGHTCAKDCSDCRTRDRGDDITNVDHGRCDKQCGREMLTCNHDCSRPCHGKDAPCLPCNAPCQSDCVHLKCKKLCNDPCPPCTSEECPSGCPHSTCKMPCAAPCDLIPCSKRCKEQLKCGHQCPSLCGEVCPTVDFCRRCAKDTIKSVVVDPLTNESYEDVEHQCLFLPCGHFFTVGALDRHLNIAAYYEMDDHRETSVPVALKDNIPPLSLDKPKGCPVCHGSLHTISRYGRIVRRALLDGKAEKFIATSNKALFPLMKRLQEHEKSLSGSIDKARLLGDITLGIEATVSAQKGRESSPYTSALKGTDKRYLKIVILQLEIRGLADKIQCEELPFRKVRELVGAAGRRKDSDFNIDQDFLKTSTSLLSVQALLLRCELVIATDLVTLWQSKQGEQQTKFFVNFGTNRKDCDALLANAIESNDILQQVEAHIFWAQFLALDCMARISKTEQAAKIQAKKNEAIARLIEADKVCKEFPEETETVAAEIWSVRGMLRYT